MSFYYYNYIKFYSLERRVGESFLYRFKPLRGRNEISDNDLAQNKFFTYSHLNIL